MRIKDQVWQSEDIFLKWLRESKGLSKTSVWHYYTYYKDFVKQDLTQENIDKFLQKKKNNSVVRGFMKSFLEFLKVEKDFEIMAKPTGRKKKRIIRDFSPHQIDQVRSYSYEKSLRDGLMFDLLYYGALRIDELINVKVNSFDWNNYFMHPERHCKLIVLGKGKKHRPVLIPPETMKRLLALYLEKKIITLGMDGEFMAGKLMSMQDPLFHNLYNWRIWKNIQRNSLKAIGIAMRPHELRHTRATEFEKKGITIRSIQKYLGHTNTETTEIYLHTSQKESLENIEKIIG